MPFAVVEVQSGKIALVDEAGNFLGVIDDSGTKRLAMAAKLQRASDGAVVNPATEDTLTQIKAKTDNIPVLVGGRTPVDGSGVTQPISATALPLPSGAATETTLAAIKDTAGIKKITDALPTGDNTIGRAKVTDGTNVLGVDSQNHAYVAGKSVPGVAPSSNPVSVSGVDEGGLKRALLTDVTGRLQVIGSGGGGSQQVEGRAADGVTPVGNPVLIGGQDGANVQSILTDTQGRLIVAPAGTTAARKGFVDGRAVLAATTPAVVRSTTYTEQTTNAQRSLVSSSANDASAGTGARTVEITYFDQTLAGPYTETVTLNGTTPVNTVASNICFIERMEIVTVGTGGVAAGIISLKAATGGGGATIWSIATGDDRTYGAHHYIPTGYTAYITGFVGSIKGADSAGFAIRAKNPLNTTDIDLQISGLVRCPTNGSFMRSYGTAISIAGPARFVTWAFPDSTSSRTYYAEIDFYEQAS